MEHLQSKHDYLLDSTQLELMSLSIFSTFAKSYRSGLIGPLIVIIDARNLCIYAPMCSFASCLGIDYRSSYSKMT